MHLVAQYKQFAADYRRLAATLTRPADKQALELLATGWDRIAENHEAKLRVRYFLRVAKGLNYQTLAICRSFALARAAFAVAVAEKPAGSFAAGRAWCSGTRRATGERVSHHAP